MTHERTRDHHRHTAPDHRPMIPEFRPPKDAFDVAVREARLRHDEVNPDRNMKWR